MFQDRDPGDETRHVPFAFGVMPFREISLDEAHQLFPLPQHVATYDLLRGGRAPLLPATVDDREADYERPATNRAQIIPRNIPHSVEDAFALPPADVAAYLAMADRVVFVGPWGAFAA